MATSSIFKYKNDTLKEEVEPQSIYQIIFNYLTNKNYDVYAPQQKRDICKEPYVVIKENGQITQGGNVTGFDLIQIFCYYPKDQYSQLEFFVNKVKKDLKELDFLIPTGNNGARIFHEDIQAYGQTIEYQNFHMLLK